MKRLFLWVVLLGGGAACGVLAQDGNGGFDTIYKFPDLPRRPMKVIRGRVVQETIEGVVYAIGLNQKKRIAPEMVLRVEYAPRKDERLNAARDLFLKGMSEYELGNYADAALMFDQAVSKVRKAAIDKSWVGAYGRYYKGLALLKEGIKKEKKGLLKSMVKKRYRESVKVFGELKEKFPAHRLQIDLPLAYAEALLRLGGAENYEKAVRLLDGVKARSRNQYVLLRELKALKLKGDVLKAWGKLDEAQSAYEEMLRLAPRGGGAIEEIVRMRQEILIYMGILMYEKAEKEKIPDLYEQAETYFKDILSTVATAGLQVEELDKIYYYLGQCRFQVRDWERAMWYYLHGSVAYFDDAEIHKKCLYKTILCLDKLIGKAEKEERKKKLTAAMAEWYRQMKDNYAGSTECVEAGKVYRKYTTK